MKSIICIVLVLLGLSVPARAQLGGILQKAQDLQEQKEKIDKLAVTEDEERKIGEQVSLKVRERFGVVQDPAIHKYVTLVGLTLARQSERPKLAWTFVVLDTDGVNAFAAPGGIVHVTRGALGLVQNEGELAAVLAHEIGHVSHKHTVNAIRKNNAVQFATSQAAGDRGEFLSRFANAAYEQIVENAFDRGDELDADAVSVQLTSKLGYAPASLADFLARLDDRNKDQPAQNGLFASHPQTKERISKVRQAAGSKAGATVAARYKEHVHYEATPITRIATVQAGSAGLAGSTASKDASSDKKEEEKKKGFGLGALKQGATPEKSSAQVTASGGSRGLGPDRDAKGGGNPGLVAVSVSQAELDAFRKGIA